MVAEDGENTTAATLDANADPLGAAEDAMSLDHVLRNAAAARSEQPLQEG
jgi:hypothetical protein